MVEFIKNNITEVIGVLCLVVGFLVGYSVRFISERDETDYHNYDGDYR